jgi:hypothetical protein
VGNQRTDQAANNVKGMMLHYLNALDPGVRISGQPILFKAQRGKYIGLYICKEHLQVEENTYAKNASK